MRALVLLMAAVTVAGTAFGAAAQGPDHKGHDQMTQGHMAHGHMTMRHGAAKDTPGDTASTRDFKAAHEDMMRSMDLPYTGDPDIDFRVHMIPHYQGAIDMARVAMKHARDPWTRQLAEAVIVEQQREIAEMQAWLANHGVKPPPGGQPTHRIGAASYRTIPEEAGTRAEARGQSWAPGSGIR